MVIDDGTWTLFGVLASTSFAAAVWIYARIGKTHDRIDKVANHMTDEDNKLHGRIDTIKDTYVRREDLDARLLRIEAGQDKMLEKLDTYDMSVRGRITNAEQVMVRADERLKHLERTKQ